MLNLLKIIATVMMARSAPIKVNLVKELLEGVAIIAGIALLIAVLTGAFVIGGLYFGYTILIDGGYSQTTAIAITAGTLLAIIAGLVWLALAKLCQIKNIPNQLAEAESPLGSKIHSISESFIDGLMNRKPEGKQQRGRKK